MKFDFDDILITPARLSEINSRSEVNPYDENEMLPIMTAPMDTVVNDVNYNYFLDNKIYAILPRHNSPNCYSNNAEVFMSYGLSEFKRDFLEVEDDSLPSKMYALIDVANGHMKILYDYARQAKERFKDRLVLMVGNIANPFTYEEFAKVNVDYIRCGIGGGQGCFVEDTLVKTENGYVPIASIQIGEKVLTHLNTYEEVIGKTSFMSEETCIVINDTNTSTVNHEYYVLHEKFKDIVTDENIHQYAQWIPADKLTNEYFLLELE